MVDTEGAGAAETEPVKTSVDTVKKLSYLKLSRHSYVSESRFVDRRIARVGKKDRSSRIALSVLHYSRSLRTKSNVSPTRLGSADQ